VVELLDELPEDQRSAVRARLVDDRDYREIATTEGVPRPPLSWPWRWW
jgi:DNA-directed RNA polymerase specialized sigma24 family protein